MTLLMTSIDRKPSGLSRQELSDWNVRKFIQQQCAMGETLVCPLMLVWWEYKEWHIASYLEVPSVQEFRTSVDNLPWASIEERKGRGRFKTIITGLGLKPRVS